MAVTPTLKDDVPEYHNTDQLLDKITSLQEQLVLREKELDEVVRNRDHILSQVAEYEERLQKLTTESQQREEERLASVLLKDENDSLRYSVRNVINEKNCIMEQLEVVMYFYVFRLWRKNTAK